MEEIVQLVSEVKKWTIQQTLGVTCQNARRFFESGRLAAQTDQNTGNFITSVKYIELFVRMIKFQRISSPISFGKDLVSKY